MKFKKYFGNSISTPGPAGAVWNRTGLRQEITELIN